MDFNQVILLGRIGRDPESKQAGGKTLANFSVATSYGTGDKKKTEWHNITAWEKLAETVLKFAHKGDQVQVVGRLSYNTVGEGDAKKTYAQITANNVIFVGGKPAGDGQGSATGSATTRTATTELADEDIPF
jgi:single-strand DNA-binding protein